MTAGRARAREAHRWKGTCTMAGRPQDLRTLAEAHRRAADRLTLLRLRLTRGMSDLTGTGRPAGTAAPVQEELAAARARWVEEVSPALGRTAQDLRALRLRLEQQADAAERAGGRRMGGYQGAGFLGRGDRAREQVRQVAEFPGHRLGASIGGWPLPAAGTGPAMPHPSDVLGAGTPAYEDEDD